MILLPVRFEDKAAFSEYLYSGLLTVVSVEIAARGHTISHVNYVLPRSSVAITKRQLFGGEHVLT